jgi:hypothetical protein
VDDKAMQHAPQDEELRRFLAKASELLGIQKGK